MIRIRDTMRDMMRDKKRMNSIKNKLAYRSWLGLISSLVLAVSLLSLAPAAAWADDGLSADSSSDQNSNLNSNSVSSDSTPSPDSSSDENAAVDTANDTSPQAKEAFEQMIKNYFPLTPNEIQQFKNRAALQAQANARPAGAAPAEGVSSVIQVSMNPGDAMPVVRVGQGMITSLVFTDSAGQVWPITSYSIGDASAFNVQWDKKSGVMMIQGQKLYTETNMGVMLEGQQIPVMLTLLIGQKSYDYMDYVRIQGYQPGDQDMADQEASEAPEYLVKTLEGLPPSDSQPLQVSGADAQMWSYDGSYLLLTRATLLSPAWSAKFVGTGSNPLHVYQLSETPYILLSNNGVLERLTVSGGDDNND